MPQMDRIAINAPLERSRLVNRIPASQEEIGQTLMASFQGTGPGDPGVEELRNLIAQGKVGSVILMGDNITSPEQLKRLTRYLQTAAPPQAPLLIAVDQEGGMVQRLSAHKGFKGFPSAAQMARLAATDMPRAEQIYRDMAHELKTHGINMNLGPVVDMSDSSHYMGKLGRSYGTDPALVTKMAQAFIKAHKAEGVVTVLKHYPGHGTAADTHKGAGDINATWQPGELEPFRRLASQAGGIMMSHTTHEQFSDHGLPATLSAKAFNSLRKDVGFNGVTVSDAIDMNAVRKIAPYTQLLPDMVKAGNNIVILPTNDTQRDIFPTGKAFDTLAHAAKNDPDISNNIKASAANVRQLKQQLIEFNVAAQRPGMTGRKPV